MMEAATAAGVKLMVGHKRRLRPQYAKMSQVVRSGRLGRVMAVDINGFYHRDWWSWWLRRDLGGGLLHVSGVHDIDFLRHICGEAGNVFARSPVKTAHRSDFEDEISALIHFESGAVATLQVSPFSPVRTFRLDLKSGKLTHQDLGQMQMYVNYFDRYVKTDDELPTVGILLCDRKNDAVVELTLPEDANIYASKYHLYLPSKRELAATPHRFHPAAAPRRRHGRRPRP